VGGYGPGGQVGGYGPGGGQIGGYGPGGPQVGYGPGPGFGPPAKSGTKRGLLIGGGILALIIVIIVIAASLSSKGTPAANGSTSPSPNPTTSTASPTPSTGVQSLSTIMNPQGQAPVGTNCVTAPLAGLNAATITNRTFCRKTSINFTPTNHIVVWGYQFDSHNDYLAGFSKINSVTGFKAAGAIHSCYKPTPTTSQVGSTTWQANQNPRYDKNHSQGQDLECFTEYTTSHVYQPLLIWTMPSQNVVFIGRDEASGATLSQLYHWWTYLNYS
jgi:hypothetical protein